MVGFFFNRRSEFQLFLGKIFIRISFLLFFSCLFLRCTLKAFVPFSILFEETRRNVESNIESNMCSHATWMGKEVKRMITVFLPEKEAPSKELSMSMQLGWVKN